MTTISLPRRATALAASLAIGALAIAPAGASAFPIKPTLLKRFSCNVTATHSGTNGADNIITGGANDRILLFGGPDSAQSGGGHDLICGGDGVDAGLYGQLGNDVIRAGAGNDHNIMGQEGNDWIFGDAGNDTLGSHPGKDYVYGGADNDTLFGDTYGVEGEADKDHLNGGPGYDTCYPGWEDTVSSCENVIAQPEPPA